ncbi:MAG: hypothetical protein E7554_00845 [Ruminococcaceae bacterium]|nr:hypothetical protein [Oscillospiraceae bacterium]
MKNILKVLAAMAVMAGVCLAVYELFRRWDEYRREQPNAGLRSFINHGLRKKKADDDDYAIADYRDDDDDFLFDDDFFADLDGSGKVEVEIEENAGDDDDAPAVSFDLSEDALEQLLDN